MSETTGETTSDIVRALESNVAVQKSEALRLARLNAAFLSELADYAATVKRLNAEIKRLNDEIADREAHIASLLYPDDGLPEDDGPVPGCDCHDCMD